MKSFFQHDKADSLQVPAAPAAVVVERLLWVFMLSFALDYRASEARAGGGGAGIDQLLFLAGAVFSTAGILWVGWRKLLVRPGVWLLAWWAGFLAFMAINVVAQGVPPGRFLRVVLPMGLCLCGMMNAHIAGCLGVRPGRIVLPVLAAACLNIPWRIFHGFMFKDVTMETVRVEVQSPANNWLAAWLGCALLLRPRLHWSLPAAGLVLMTGIGITVSRSLLFPLAISLVAASGFYLAGLFLGLFSLGEMKQKVLPGLAAAAILVGAFGVAAAATPGLLERWNERLFHHISDRNISEDVSWLTRKAEAEEIMARMKKEPMSYIYGHGMGASYSWSLAYTPELRMVFPKELDMGSEVWFAGHSVWTYALFSGGALGVLAHAGLFAGVIGAALAAARANAGRPGPDMWLVFLPAVAALCFLSESATSNPFDERLMGMMFGMMAGLPQAFHVRAFWGSTAGKAYPMA